MFCCPNIRASWLRTFIFALHRPCFDPWSPHSPILPVILHVCAWLSCEPCWLGWIDFRFFLTQKHTPHEITHSLQIWIWFAISTKFTKSVLLINCSNETSVVTVLTTIFVSDSPLLTRVLTDDPLTPLRVNELLHLLPFFLPEQRLPQNFWVSVQSLWF